MRDVTMPYRAVPEERRSVNFYFILSAVLAGALLAFAAGVNNLSNKVAALEQDNTAMKACLNNLHIVMKRLDNPGPEQGVVVAKVNCKGE